MLVVLPLQMNKESQVHAIELTHRVIRQDFKLVNIFEGLDKLTKFDQILISICQSWNQHVANPNRLPDI